MTATPKRLFDFPFSGNGYKVRLALAHLGWRVEYETIDLLAGDAARPAFLARNPMGQIPVLELDDGTYLRESNSILYWLCDGSSLMPEDRLSRARVIQWMCFEQSNIDKVLGRTRFLRCYPDFMATTKADWDGWYATGYRALDVLDAALRDADFIVGDRYSAADICLYGYVHCADRGRLRSSAAYERDALAEPRTQSAAPCLHQRRRRVVPTGSRVAHALNETTCAT